MKVGISQATRPAPVWFRRLRDGCVNFLLPALGQLITSLNLTPENTNTWLQVLTFLPAAFNFIGVLLGEDVKKRVRVWLVFVLASSAMLTSCKTSEQLAAETARAREQHMQLLQQVRLQLPCIPDTIIRGQTVYLPGDSIPCSSTGKCPPPGVRVDTLKVLDEAALAALRDSIAQAAYVAELKDKRIDEMATANAQMASVLARAQDKTAFWRRIVLWGGGLLTAAGGIWLVVGGKLSIIKKAFSWLISPWR